MQETPLAALKPHGSMEEEEEEGRKRSMTVDRRVCICAAAVMITESSPRARGDPSVGTVRVRETSGRVRGVAVGRGANNGSVGSASRVRWSK